MDVGVTQPSGGRRSVLGGEGESGERWLTHKALFIPPVSQIQGLELNDCCFCLSVSTDKLASVRNSDVMVKSEVRGQRATD